MRMTTAQTKKEGRGELLFCIMSLVCLLLTFICSSDVISAMQDSMALCTRTVIPSLFPFMVLSEILVSSGGISLIGRLLASPLSTLLGVSREGASAFLLGVLCGFPVGTSSALSLHESGKISQNELEHLCTFCSFPSSGFIIGAIGSVLFASPLFGILLYISQIISSLAIGIIGRLFFCDKSRHLKTGCTEHTRVSGAQIITSAVQKSALSMLYISAFILFFSAVVGAMRGVLSKNGFPPVISALLLAFFELTGGSAQASALPLDIAIILTAAAVGWSGLSVHFQFISLLGNTKIRLGRYFCAKAANAILNVAFVRIFVYLFRNRLDFSERSAASVSALPHTPLSLGVLFVFLFCLLTLSARVKRGKKF